MASFSPNKLTTDSVNNGNEFTNGQGLQPNDINSIVKGVLWLNENGGSGSSGGSTIYKHTFTFKVTDGETTNEIYGGVFYATTTNKLIEHNNLNFFINNNNAKFVLSPIYYNTDSGYGSMIVDYDNGGYKENNGFNSYSIMSITEDWEEV